MNYLYTYSLQRNLTANCYEYDRMLECYLSAKMSTKSAHRELINENVSVTSIQFHEEYLEGLHQNAKIQLSCAADVKR